MKECFTAGICTDSQAFPTHKLGSTELHRGGNVSTVEARKDRKKGRAGTKGIVSLLYFPYRASGLTIKGEKVTNGV